MRQLGRYVMRRPYVPDVGTRHLGAGGLRGDENEPAHQQPATDQGLGPQMGEYRSRDVIGRWHLRSNGRGPRLPSQAGKWKIFRRGKANAPCRASPARGGQGIADQVARSRGQRGGGGCAQRSGRLRGRAGQSSFRRRPRFACFVLQTGPTHSVSLQHSVAYARILRATRGAQARGKCRAFHFFSGGPSTPGGARHRRRIEKAAGPGRDQGGFGSATRTRQPPPLRLAGAGFEPATSGI